MLLLGAVGGTLGFGACSPWLVERLERPARLLPLASRIALRDTARARSRNGPIITAILASFAATVALAAYSTSLEARNAATWQPYMQSDQIYLQGNVNEAGPEVARQLDAIAAAPVPCIPAKEGQWPVVSTGSGAARQEYGNVTVGDTELLKVLHAEDETTALQAGSVVLFTDDPLAARTATLALTDKQGTITDSIALPVANVVTALPRDGQPPTGRHLGGHRSPVRPGGPRERVEHALPHPAGPRRHRGRPGQGWRACWLLPRYLCRRRAPPEAGRRGFPMGDDRRQPAVGPERDGVAVALGEAESRPEQRTLLALGRSQACAAGWRQRGPAPSPSWPASSPFRPACCRCGACSPAATPRSSCRCPRCWPPSGAPGAGDPGDAAPEPSDPQLVRIPRPRSVGATGQGPIGAVA